MAKEHRGQIILDAIDDTARAFAQVETRFNHLKMQAQGAMANIQRNFASLGIAMGAAGLAGAGAWQMLEESMQFEEQKKSLNGLAQQYGATADSIIDSMKRAADGQLSMADAADIAGQGLMKGLRPEQIEQLTEAAQRLGDVTGTSVKEGLASMVNGLATGRMRTLEAIVGNIDLKASLGAQVEKMSEAQKIQATYNIFLEKYKGILDQLGPASSSAADSMDRFKAVVADLKLSIGQNVLQPLFLFLARATYDLMALFEGFQALLSDIRDATGISKLMGYNKNGSEYLEHLDKAAEYARKSKEAAELFNQILNPTAAGAKRSLATVNMPMVTQAELDEQKKAAEKMLKVRQGFLEKIKTLLQDETANKLDALAKEVAAMHAAGVSKVQIAQYEAKARLKIEEDRIKAQRAMVDRYQQIEESRIRLGLSDVGLAEGAEPTRSAGERGGFASQRIALYQDLLTLQEDYLRGVDRATEPEAWYKASEAIIETKKQLQELNETLLQATGSFNEGFVRGLQDYFDQMNSQFQDGIDAATRSAQAMSDAFQTFFFDALTNQLKAAEDYWNQFKAAIARIMADLTAKWMMTGLAKIIGALFKSTGGGGGTIVNDIWAAVGHSGGLVKKYHLGGLAGDEVPAILQAGEFVLSREMMRALQGTGDRGQGAGRPIIVNMNIMATDADSFRGQLYRNKSAVVEAVQAAFADNHPARRARL